MECRSKNKEKLQKDFYVFYVSTMFSILSLKQRQNFPENQKSKGKCENQNDTTYGRLCLKNPKTYGTLSIRLRKWNTNRVFKALFGRD